MREFLSREPAWKLKLEALKKQHRVYARALVTPLRPGQMLRHERRKKKSARVTSTPENVKKKKTKKNRSLGSISFFEILCSFSREKWDARGMRQKFWTNFRTLGMTRRSPRVRMMARVCRRGFVCALQRLLFQRGLPLYAGDDFTGQTRIIVTRSEINPRINVSRQFARALVYAVIDIFE